MDIGIGRRRGLGGTALTIGLLLTQPAVAQVAPRGGYGDPSTVDAAGLYAAACAPCHGQIGDGNAPGARLLGPSLPRDFTTGIFKLRSTPAYSLPTDEDLARTIVRGIPGTWMPAWGDMLTPAQIQALVDYLKGFSPIWTESEAEPPLAIPPPPTDTAGMVVDGRIVYAVLECWRCHGLTGRGDGPSANELYDDWDRRIDPYDFTRGSYKAGKSAEDLYRTLVTGLSGTPMPALEPELVAFPGGGDEDVSGLESQLDAQVMAEVNSYLAGQPSAAEIQSLTPTELDHLVQHRLWALVYYVLSLERTTGVFHWLFGDTPEFSTGSGR